MHQIASISILKIHLARLEGSVSFRWAKSSACPGLCRLKMILSLWHDIWKTLMNNVRSSQKLRASEAREHRFSISFCIEIKLKLIAYELFLNKFSTFDAFAADHSERRKETLGETNLSLISEDFFASRLSWNRYSATSYRVRRSLTSTFH